MWKAFEDMRQKKLKKDRKKRIRCSFVLLCVLFSILFAGCQKNVSKEEDTAGEQKDPIQEQIEQMSLEEKVAQLFMITPEQLTGYGQVVQAGEATQKALQKYPVGGLIFFSQNIEGEEQLKNMLTDLKKINASVQERPLFLGIDEEGGQVARIANSGKCNVKKIPALSTLQGKEEVYESASYIGSYLDRYGFNVDFAPLADISDETTSAAIKYRAFGSDPKEVSTKVNAYLKGLKEEHILGAVKHFPGQGAVKQDTHVESGYIEKSFEEMKESDLYPFQQAIDQDVPFIMVSHMIPGGKDSKELPSSMNEKVMTQLLREEMGYRNLIITDAFNMEAITKYYPASKAATQAIKAGADIILMPSDFKAAYEGVIEAVQEGEISEKRIDESIKRILTIKKRE